MEWATVLGWRRRSARSGPRAQRVAGDALRALRAGVLVLDDADQPIVANPAATELGLLRGPSAGGGAGAQVHPRVRTLASQARRIGKRREVELDLPREAERGRLPGEPLGVRVGVTPLDGSGYPPGHVVIEAVDVTEAHRVARVRRDFVANVSHELKTPVGALVLLAETLLEAADDPVASRRFAERIHHESRRLARLVQELLELSRLQGAEPRPAPVPVAVDQVIHEVVDRTRTAAAAKRVDVRVGPPSGVVVSGNESQLVTAVANLVENAIAYSADETTVTIAVRVAGDTVEIAVTDQGIGIAPGDVDRIFERFYRTDQARSRDTGGTGLGLAIVRHIAVNHGGRVDVSSRLGSGSVFTLRLPARPQLVTKASPSGGEIDVPAGIT